MRMRVVALLLAVTGSGCGSVRPTRPPEALRCDLKSFEVEDIYGLWFRARPIAPPRAFHVLALSAGGEFGAYGAGFLKGWGSVGEAAVPSARSDIQVVTGVSTGAIMATHAFLGDDDRLLYLYTHLSGAKIYRKRGLLEYVRGNSLYDATGKEQLIRDNLGDDVVQRVVEEAERSERSLFIGVVDLDSGRFVRIDMVALARTLPPDTRGDCYRAVISASSAIPIAFQPRFVDDRMLVDGGARWHLFLTSPPGPLSHPGVDRHLFALVHGDLDVAPDRPKNGVLQIAGRTSEILTDQSLRSSVQWMDVLARGGPEQDLPRFGTSYASAAAAACACAAQQASCAGGGGLDSGDMFCQPFMECLAEHGQADGRAYASGAHPWLRIGDVFPTRRTVCPEPVHRRLGQ